MIHLIVLILFVVLLILSIISGYIAAHDLEKKYPRWLSINWSFIFCLFMVIVGLCYFVYYVGSYILNAFEYLKNLIYVS